ncbi:MAG: cyclase family protein [Steroidobacterales bacterium]
MRAITLTLGAEEFKADLARPADISVALEFGGAQPSYFDAPAARAAALHVEGFVGDTREGGSCNCSEYTLIAHCNGTHTECVGHVTDDRVSVRDALRPGLHLALLMSVKPESADVTTERTLPQPKPRDLMVTAKSIEAALARFPERAAEVWVIRTQPNYSDKARRRYRADNPPPYYSREAVELAVARNIEHLVTDLPSLDRSYDEGRLTGHRIFWGLPPGSRDAKAAQRPHATITELAFVPTAVRDGWYLVDLQIAPFASDAAPSRPILYPLIPGARAA